MNKKAFITGGSRGIGRGIAIELAKKGYDIAFTYHSAKDSAESLKNDIINLNQQCFYYQASLEKPGIAEKVTHKAIEDLNGIDVLVCNAGKTKFTNIQTLEPEMIDYLYHLDFRSYLMSTKIAANYMIDHHTHGSIIYITSTRGIRAYRNDVVYGSIKAALNRSVESLAIELSDYHINVNAVAPGAIETRGDMTEEQLTSGRRAKLVPLQRKGTPKDVASLVSFLVSDQAQYITGETIKVDGGLILYGPNESREGGLY